MKFDEKTRHAIHHTVHCLVGCGLGEILGMVIAASLGWHRAGRVGLALALAFLVGYSLTYRSVRKDSTSAQQAIKITLATDTSSIVTMEIVDNIIEFIIPNALVVTAASFRFWWGLGVSLMIAFVVTVPVNRYLMNRQSTSAHS